MSGRPAVSLVCCGLLGTTVNDQGILERAFSEACATQGIVPGTAAYARNMVTVHKLRGQPPLEVFRAMFPGGDGRAEAAAMSFERSLRAALDRTRLSPAAGAEEAIAQLHDAGIRFCVMTSVPRRLMGIVLDALGWWRRVDLALSPDDVPRGCPWPDLMLTAMLRLGVEDVREAAYAGSTASGVLCGKRSGAGIVAGVLDGGHTGDRLRASGATHLISGIGELPGLLAGRAEASQPPQPSAPAPRVPLERRRAGL